MFSMNLIKAICIGGYLIWRFLCPSQIHQLKSPPNINRFTEVTESHQIFTAYLYMVMGYR